MKLYLIRHGETVDNIAGLYAGIRDSILTNYGVEQARRLGSYFAKEDVKITDIFSSPLIRAVKTAEAVRDAQVKLRKKDDDRSTNGSQLDVVQIKDLIEQDFGYYEGKPFYARSESSKTGREAHYERHKHDPGFVDVESKESMGKRADAFLDEHLLPLFRTKSESMEPVVVVVSHGILLSNLWRRLLLRLPRKSLTIAPEIVASKSNIVLEHLGGWSNTGFLELSMNKEEATPVPFTSNDTNISRANIEPDTLSTPVPPAVDSHSAMVSIKNPPTELDRSGTSIKSRSSMLQGWSTTILAIDSKAHLVGLKRQRGGIGRLAHDDGQKKLDDFFKRQKTG